MRLVPHSGFAGNMMLLPDAVRELYSSIHGILYDILN